MFSKAFLAGPIVKWIGAVAVSGMLVAVPVVALSHSKLDAQETKVEAAAKRAAAAEANGVQTGKSASDEASSSAAAAASTAQNFAGGVSKSASGVSGSAGAEGAASDGKGGGVSVSGGTSGVKASGSVPNAPTVPKVGAPPLPAAGVPSLGLPGLTPDLPPYDHGTYVVVVPGTEAVSKKLCARGNPVDACKTVTVPALQPVVLTVSYSANMGTQIPTLTPGTCVGGLTVNVAGLAPGSHISAVASGNGASAALTATVAATPVNETVSFCDA